MDTMRTRFQGITNVVRFNWHLYLIAVAFTLSLLILSVYTSKLTSTLCIIAASGALIATAISLIASHYIYDKSHLYDLNFLQTLAINVNSTVVNIHAGFDETSEIIREKYALEKLLVFDFYNPGKHTEVSIKRARNAYPAYSGTLQITTSDIPLPDHSADFIFIIFSAHEIRDDEERIMFFKELKRVLKANGKCIVTEHLRNSSNFAAYNIGFLHFLSEKTWSKTFLGTGFLVEHKIKTTPFITTYILIKDGVAT